MKTYESIALGIPEILLPQEGIDLSKWAVIACDQYTSEPDYWKRVEQIVGEDPSSLNLIFPEVYLGEKDQEERIQRIRENMHRYLEQGIFQKFEGFVYVERKTGHGIRKGLMANLDLEQYDFHKGATSLIRATEGTILDRIPPRVKIREGAPLEIPHIMVLIDDPQNTVIGPLTQKKNELSKLYDFDLMMDSGHLSGYKVDEGTIQDHIIQSLHSLADPQNFSQKYGLSPETPLLLYAMGDGNHSFATAKTIWDKTKEKALDKKEVMNSPLRYALVELVNLHDEALVFEPIHRVLFHISSGLNVLDKMKSFYPQGCRFTPMGTIPEMMEEVDAPQESSHKIGVTSEKGVGVIEIEKPQSNLPAGTLQNFLNSLLEEKGAQKVDYVHGKESLVQLGNKPENMGFYLPAMDKNELFKTVILDGSLPRKTFSMGEAWEKRFYMEARKLIQD